MNWRELPYDCVLPDCASTNDLARELARAGAPSGTWISARRQTVGRGRMGREWNSSGANVYLSMVFRAESSAISGWIPLRLGLAAHAAIGSLVPREKLRLKWPNDILIANADGSPKKLAGILCEASVNGSSLELVCGIGVNCAPVPVELEQLAGHVAIDPDLVREKIIAHWQAEMSEASLNVATLSASYAKNLIWNEGDALYFTPIINGALSTRQSGTFQGLSDDGGLRVRLSSGEVRTLYSDEVSLR